MIQCARKRNGISFEVTNSNIENKLATINSKGYPSNRYPEMNVITERTANLRKSQQVFMEQDESTVSRAFTNRQVCKQLDGLFRNHKLQGSVESVKGGDYASTSASRNHKRTNLSMQSPTGLHLRTMKLNEASVTNYENIQTGSVELLKGGHETNPNFSISMKLVENDSA